MKSSLAFHNKVIGLFNKTAYENILDESCIFGDERALSDKTTTGYTLKKGKKIYFVNSHYIDLLPVKIKKYQKIIDRTNVYYLPQKEYVDELGNKRDDGIVTMRIIGKDNMSFRKLIDSFCDFEHSKPLHLKLYKIMILGAYIGKLHWRVATKVSFGKTSVMDCLRDLTSNCARIDRASPAKLDYVLKFPFILINEIANLNRTDKEIFIQFLISVGDGANKYTKPTRKSNGSKEIYDLSNVSLCLTYNNAEYFRKKNQESFDDFFLENIKDRYLPLKFEGFLDTNQFKEEGEDDFIPEEELNKCKPFYLQILEQLSYFKKNRFNLKYAFPKELKFKSNRWQTQFKKICIFISHYAKDKKEYDDMIKELYDCHQKYLVEEIEPNYEGLIKEEIIR